MKLLKQMINVFKNHFGVLKDIYTSTVDFNVYSNEKERFDLHEEKDGLKGPIVEIM